jgi:Domain of unknown function (DUF5658)
MVDALRRPLGANIVFFCMAIVGLNLLDAFATLRHIEHGAAEVNPLMQALLRHGALRFLLVKHVVVSLGLCGIAFRSEERVARGTLWVLFPVYLVLGAYQICLFYVM